MNKMCFRNLKVCLNWAMNASFKQVYIIVNHSKNIISHMEKIRELGAEQIT